ELVPDKPPEERVVEQQKAQPESQQVEESVVSRYADQDLQQSDQSSSANPQASRRKDQKRHNQLDREHEDGRELLKPVRQLVHVPGRRGRQRLGVIVVLERGQVAPRRVPAQKLDRAGQEHQPEQEPAQQPQHGGRRR